MSSTSSLRARMLKWGSIPLGLVLSGALIWQASYAAFSDTTTNPGNSWTAAGDDGTWPHFTLTDDSQGVAMFDVTGAVPADTGARCIATTYEGPVRAHLRFYVENGTTTNGLADHITVNIQEGSGGSGNRGSFLSCGNFSPAAGGSLYSGSLSRLMQNHRDYDTGAIGTTGTMTDGTRKHFRITYTYNGNAPQSTQDGTVTADFTFEARSA